jgi:hypothetical protein
MDKEDVDGLLIDYYAMDYCLIIKRNGIMPFVGKF